jgi:protein involved in polysaccharide export with SLBB domain
LANGFKNRANVTEIEIYRQITDAKTLNENINKAESFKIKMSKDMDSGEATTFKLKREDRVIVRTIFGAEDIKEVKIEGEVIAPGNYVLQAKNQHISDLIKESGGLSAYAYPAGAFIIRQQEKKETEKKLLENTAQTALKIQKQVKSDSDSIQIVKNILNEPNMVAIELEKILKYPGSKYDLQLEAGDLLSIPKQLETVSISGEVLMPAITRYQSGKSLKYYINHAGGFGIRAMADKIYVIHPNGSVDATTHFLGFRSYPKITPGSRIIVPEKPVKKGMSAVETVSITSSILTVAALIFSILKGL